MFTEKQTYKYPKKLMQGGRKFQAGKRYSNRTQFGVNIITNVRNLGLLFFKSMKVFLLFCFDALKICICSHS